MKLFAHDALLPTGWSKDVVLEIAHDGTIDALEIALEAPADAERTQGPVIPGMPNLHSHAFQRALAGLTERGGPATDTFWTWRAEMYRFLERIDPEDQEAIAAQVYIEMLKSGYTAVAEFQYLHHDPNGEPYADPAEMATRIVAASAATGIGLTLLPVFYAHSNFGGAPATPEQRRFLHDPDGFRLLVERLVPLTGDGGPVVGIAPHSLRAVTPNQLQWLEGLAEDGLVEGPIHIHAAEQQKEVDDCLSWSGARPVQWLLDNVALDARWCVVHATHMNADETRRLAASRAVAGLCPSTEADLGDGIFPTVEYLAAGGRLGIGGDSHVGVDPFAELRLIDTAQRLTRGRRNLLVGDGESSGLALFRAALAGGAQALAQPIGAIALGHRADLVVLDAEEASLVAQPPENLLDAAIFGPGKRLVRDVMVGGRWVIGEGHHADEEAILTRYRQTMKRLLG